MSGVQPETRWRNKAAENIEKWGVQDKETLVIAMMEELGELAQAILKYNELPYDIDPDTQEQARNHMLNECDDLAALMFQMERVL